MPQIHTGGPVRHCHARQLIFQLSHNCRLVDDGLQWILEIQKGRTTHKSSGWRAKAYCLSRTGVIRHATRLCPDMPQAVVLHLKSLREFHNGQG